VDDLLAMDGSAALAGTTCRARRWRATANWSPITTNGSSAPRGPAMISTLPMLLQVTEALRAMGVDEF
jgi:hypothetical protein